MAHHIAESISCPPVYEGSRESGLHGVSRIKPTRSLSTRSLVKSKHSGQRVFTLSANAFFGCASARDEDSSIFTRSKSIRQKNSSHSRSVSLTSVGSWLRTKSSSTNRSASSITSIEDNHISPHCNLSSIVDPPKPPLSNYFDTLAHKLKINANPQMLVREVSAMKTDHEIMNHTADFASQPADTYPPTIKPTYSAIRERARKFWRTGRNQKEQRVVTTTPPRPNRPPPAQCPPDQPFFSLIRSRVFPDAPLLVPFPSYSAAIQEALRAQAEYLLSSKEGKSYEEDIKDQDEIHPEVHHEVAYKRLSNDMDLGPSISDPSEPCYDTVSIFSDQKTPSEASSVYSQESEASLDDITHRKIRGSFSSLPSTKSKLALRPSPLRLDRNFSEPAVPPVPMRSPLRLLSFEQEMNGKRRREQRWL